MTVDEINKRVEEIRANSGDDESAHSYEDSLHQDVLAAIAEGRREDAAACAKAALATIGIKFGRWCA